MNPADAAEMRQAKVVLSYAIPAAVWAMVLVGVYCSAHTQRQAGELFTVMLGAVVGSLAITFLVGVVTRVEES